MKCGVRSNWFSDLAHFGFLEFKTANQTEENVDENHRFPFVSSSKVYFSFELSLSFKFIHLSPNTRPLFVSKCVEVYHLPAPDFILSIQTSLAYQDDANKPKSGIQTETERAIQNGLTAIAKIICKHEHFR